MIINTSRIVSDRKYCMKLFNYYQKRKSLTREKTSCKNHTDKAFTNLDLGNYLLEEHKHSIKELFPKRNYYDWCITIYYYSVYHASLALLSKIGYKSNNHMATISAIALFYCHKSDILRISEINLLIKTVAIKEEDINLIIKSKDIRERASYGAGESFSALLAENYREEVSEFVNRIRGFMEH